MKVTLVNPNWKLHYLPHTTASIRPPKSVPLELAYIASSIKDTNDVNVIDAYAEELTNDKVVDMIYSSGSELVVIDTTPTYLFWRCPPLDLSVPSDLTKILKLNTNVQIALIGPHGTNDPKWSMNKTGADIIIRGEPDTVFKNVIDSGFQKGIYPNMGPVNLKDLSFPSFDMFDFTKYDAHAWLPSVKKYLTGGGKSNFALEFSRGCDFSCVYCFKEGFRNKLRQKSLPQMATELDYVTKKGGTYIYFIDEIFNRPSNELLILLKMLKERGIKFGNQSRPDIMTEEMVELMADNGCIYIEYGVESQDERVARKIKKNISSEKLERILELSHEVIPVVNEFRINFYSPDYAKILGLPERPVSEWDKKLIRPYPGTFLGEKLFERYGIKENKWEFALRYTWWLQVEKKIKLEEVPPENHLKQDILFGNYDISLGKVRKILE